MHHLKGYTHKEVYCFHGENLSDVLGEVSLFCARQEAVTFVGPEFHISQQYDAETGEYLIILLELA